MSYLDETLTAGEVVHYRTGLHWTVLVGPIALAMLLVSGAVALLIVAAGAGPPAAIGGLVCLALAAVTVFVGVLRRSSIEIAVTNHRVLIKTGILARKTVELLLGKVESVGVEQSLVGRMADYGRVVVRGTGGTHEVFDRIAHPVEFRRQVQERLQPPAANSPARQGMA
jgi:uncharacterized membrane protein YdbT with pleckstrin-like domain